MVPPRIYFVSSRVEVDKGCVQKLSMVQVMNQDGAERFLKSWGIRVEEWRVRELVTALPDVLIGREGCSLRSCYLGRDLMSKRSAYKIKKLYEKGSLDPYLHHLDADRDWHPPLGEKKFGDRIRGLLNSWLAETSEEYLREVLRFIVGRELLPKDLTATAEALVLRSEGMNRVADQERVKYYFDSTLISKFIKQRLGY